MKRRLFSRICLSWLLIVYLGAGHLAWAEADLSQSSAAAGMDLASPQVSPSPTPVPDPSPTPTASPSPTPEAATGEKTDAPGAPSPSPSPNLSGAKEQPSTSDDTGATEPTGVKPEAVFNTQTQQWERPDSASFKYDKTKGWQSPLYQFNKETGRYEKTSGGSESAPASQGTELASIMNSLQGQSTTGDAAAVKNSQAGNVASGTAAAFANVVNLLAAAWSASGGKLATFMQNLPGDQTGDVKLDPDHLAATTDLSGTGGGGDPAGLAVKVKTGGSITNDVDLAAQSGAASAKDNTKVGDVSSGDAFAGANIMNVMHSFISSGQSFFGMLNILGNLKGDILFPTGFLNGLAAEEPADKAAAPTKNEWAADIANNIDLTARSGAAKAEDNGKAGSVTSGDTGTASNIFNMANTSIWGDNAVLVIVNVMGHWVGHIMNLPGGSTEAALLTDNAQQELRPAVVPPIDRAALDESIVNNVRLTAQSGDAVASGNTEAGGVQSGTAKVASSVVNLVNSVVNVKHWFGVLVVNVFGNWLGSVNDNTEAGGLPKDQPTPMIQGGQAEVGPVAGDLALATSGLRTEATPVSDAGAEDGGDSTPREAQTPDATSEVADPVVASAQADTTAAARWASELSWIFVGLALLLLMAGTIASVVERLKRR